MLENIAMCLVLLVLGLFTILVPFVIFLNRKRKLALKEALFLCDPQGTKLKEFISNQMKSEGFFKKLVNEAVFSFKPYIDGYLANELKNGVITESNLAQYMVYDKKIKFIIKHLFSGIVLLFIILFLLGLSNL